MNWCILYLCFYFVAIICEIDSEKQGLALGVNKIREAADKCTVDKRKLLVKALQTDVDFFPDSLDEVQTLSLSDQAKKKRSTPIISHVNREKGTLVRYLILQHKRFKEFLRMRLLIRPRKENITKRLCL